MNRSELLKMAQSDQRHTAMEQAVAPLEILPHDLLAALVDSRSESGFEIHGFLMHGNWNSEESGWTAVVSGNGVMAEYWFRAHGFEHAFNGAPAYCHLRVATSDERAAYLAA